ncbi:cell division protein ZipA C-terminal FtsZ-binding domain-containing protein [Thiohalobacter sp.]|uniref:cell division protein ZipA C-terminal FtsZ-binding domain-containing protein n=1 Tax=Thiohalobacter sp. TaxID=2025948 RepID=UPI002613D16E|nr:cell division protein ZipA C-terminal FtsZ-binding domain-containing protein [Thiohalobacter sp.]
MDTLRWILLGVGAVFVAAVYWWSRRSETEPPVTRREPKVRAEAPESPSSSPEPGTPAPVPAPEAGDRVETVRDELEALGDLLAEEQARREPIQQPLGLEEERVVTLYLVAPRGAPFAGEAVQAALEAEGLSFGEMSIYHRLAPGRLPRAVFSVAGLVEPGTLEPERLASESLPGLALFLQLPGPVAPVEAFEALASTAQALAGRLGGELRDDARNPLSAQRLDALREEIAQYALRQQVDGLTS